MKEIVEAFTLGILFGLGPCMVSCAPVLVPLVVSTSKDFKQGVWYTLLFSFGRILVYILLGILFGYLGKTYSNFVSNKVVGIVIIILGIAVLSNVQNKCFLSRIKITGWHMAILAGVVMGFTPCAPMLSALAIATSAHSALLGGAIGLAFGLGTILSPILILGLLSGWWGGLEKLKEANVKVSGIFMIIVGVFYLLS